jgi:hypothetical protein
MGLVGSKNRHMALEVCLTPYVQNVGFEKKTERLEQGLSPYRCRIYNLQEAQIYVRSECVTTHASKHLAPRPQPVLVVGVYSNMPTATVLSSYD